MARPWRVEFPDAVYHVIARGNNRQKIFKDREDDQTFIRLIAAAASRFRLEVFAFCLMPNHYHLFVRTPESNLQKAMHWLNAAYARRFHLAHRSGGHLFQGRYKAVLVADEAHWLHLSAYLHLNPVRARLVEDPAGYEWSSFRDYTHKKSRFSWLRSEVVLARFGSNPVSRRRSYRGQVMALAGKPGSLWEELRSAMFLGSAEEWERLRAEHPPAGDRRSVHEFHQRARAVDFDEELERVARAFDVEAKDIRSGKRIGVGRARLALYHHLVETCGFRVTHTAGRLGLTPGAVSLGIRRFKKIMERDRKVRRLIKELMYNV